MHDLEAMRAALYLFHLPAGVRAARERPLPNGVPTLLAVAAGESEATETAAAKLERQQSVVQQAAAFYIEQILLAPDVDAYRVLGAGREASDAELRRNMALLLRWVHPDMDRAGDRSIYAGRVTGAWEALKTPDRRAAYNAANPVRARRSEAIRDKPRPRSDAKRVLMPRSATRPGLLRTAWRMLLGRRDRPG